MNIAVLAKLVPDLVEELSVDSSGVKLDTAFARFIINEFDDHAIEEAILLKERHGGQVTVVAADDEGVDDVMFTAAAKGADRLIKLAGISAVENSNHALARIFADTLSELKPDLVLTGVQAHNDLDGSVGALAAAMLGLPYLGYISGITAEDGQAVLRKEYPGGLIGEYRVATPAVVGVQAGEQPPRYVAVSKVRQAMKTCTIEERSISIREAAAELKIERMYKPEPAEHATMLEGSPEEIADKLVGIFRDVGVL
jgi:electron transfer flavoprotein beta subunit